MGKSEHHKKNRTSGALWQVFHCYCGVYSFDVKNPREISQISTRLLKHNKFALIVSITRRARKTDFLEPNSAPDCSF